MKFSHLIFQYSEILTSAIRLNVYPIDFSIYSTCPRAVDYEAHNDSVSTDTHNKRMKDDSNYHEFNLFYWPFSVRKSFECRL